LTRISKSLEVSYHSGNETHGRQQIDLVIDRADKAINLCEFKFYASPISFTPKELEALELKRDAFRQLTRTDKTLFTTLTSVKGLSPRTPVGGVINQSITIAVFFDPR